MAMHKNKLLTLVLQFEVALCKVVLLLTTLSMHHVLPVYNDAGCRHVQCVWKDCRLAARSVADGAVPDKFPSHSMRVAAQCKL